MPANSGIGRQEILRRLELGKELAEKTAEIFETYQAKGLGKGAASYAASTERSRIAQRYNFDNSQRDDCMLIHQKFSDVPKEILALLPWEALRKLRMKYTPKVYAIKVVRLMAHSVLHKDCPNTLPNITSVADAYAHFEPKEQEVDEKFAALEDELRCYPENEIIKLQEIVYNDIQDNINALSQEEKEEVTPMTTTDLLNQFSQMLKERLPDISIEEVAKIVQENKTEINLDPLISLMQSMQNSMSGGLANLENTYKNEIARQEEEKDGKIARLEKELASAHEYQAKFDDLESYLHELQLNHTALRIEMSAEKEMNTQLKAQIEMIQEHQRSLALIQDMMPGTLKMYQSQMEELHKQKEDLHENIRQLKSKIQFLELRPAIDWEAETAKIREEVTRELLGKLQH